MNNLPVQLPAKFFDQPAIACLDERPSSSTESSSALPYQLMTIAAAVLLVISAGVLW